MKNHSKWVLGLGILFLVAAPLPAKNTGGEHDHDKEKMKEIKQFLEVTNQAGIITSSVTGQMQVLRKVASGNLLKYLDEYLKETKQGEGKLQDKIADVYADHFTQEDIKALSQFFQSPVGAKFIREQPKMNEELAKASMEWDQEIKDKISSKLGPINDSGL